ncbi:MAG: hypothetical protein K0S51_682 [Bacillales bacterium]|jgi:uncharacterized protein (DUF342 family)|nr:hypothetical protein [Bacillales bacterium]
MKSYFDVKLSKDRLEAYIDLKEIVPSQVFFNHEEITKFLYDNRIVHGILEDAVRELETNLQNCSFPITIAQGTAAINGDDAYLRTEVHVNKENHDIEKVNLREVIHIPSVKVGQLLATIIPETAGTDGKDVHGNVVKSKKGKQFRFKPGKNIDIKNNTIFATIDGQVNYLPNSISVLPVFEVNSDLDMSIGNIEFIGNVNIKGNVPTGFTVKAGGDITIGGLVEGATIISDGSISIRGGVVGSNIAKLIAKKEIHVSYLNQASVECGDHLIVENSILHSKCISSGKIICKNGNIYGGSLSATHGVEAKDIGNSLFIKTDIYIGVNQKIVDREKFLKTKLAEANDTKTKLDMMLIKLNSKVKQSIPLSQAEKNMLIKQKPIYEAVTSQIEEMSDELSKFSNLFVSIENAQIICRGAIHPNVSINFGKYTQTLKHVYNTVRIKVINHEIKIIPL